MKEFILLGHVKGKFLVTLWDIKNMEKDIAKS